MAFAMVVPWRLGWHRIGTRTKSWQMASCSLLCSVLYSDYARATIYSYI